MKKTLIALAAVAVSSAALAQVTIYGVVDAGYNTKTWDSDALKAESAGVVDGALAGARVGFRGEEDLGAGMKASFVVEMGMSPTSAQLTNSRTASSGFQIDPGTTATMSGLTGRTTASLNRQSFLGLSGGFGAVRIGYQYTNVYEVSTLSGYMMGAEGVHGADFAHVAGNSYVGGTRANAITYISPNLGGFTAQLQYGAGASLQSFTHTTAQTVAPEFKAIAKNFETGALPKSDHDLAFKGDEFKNYVLSKIIEAEGAFVPNRDGVKMGKAKNLVLLSIFSETLNNDKESIKSFLDANTDKWMA
jgi:predicted porin